MSRCSHSSSARGKSRILASNSLSLRLLSLCRDSKTNRNAHLPNRNAHVPNRNAHVPLEAIDKGAFFAQAEPNLLY